MQTDRFNSGHACDKMVNQFYFIYTVIQMAKRRKTFERIICNMHDILYGTSDKYHQFIHGREIVVESDHQPLVAIIDKNKMSTRL